MVYRIAISGECHGVTSRCDHRRFDRSCRIFLCHVFAAKKGNYFQHQAETTLGRLSTRKWLNNRYQAVPLSIELTI